MNRPKYKKLYHSQQSKNKVLMWTIYLLVAFLALTILGTSVRLREQTEEIEQLQKRLDGIEHVSLTYFSEYEQAMDELEQKPDYIVPESNEDIIRSVFGDKADEALAIAKCESHLRSDARNSQSTATGLFQIMASVHGVRRDWLENPIINTQIAKSLYEASGWNPWVCKWAVN